MVPLFGFHQKLMQVLPIWCKKALPHHSSSSTPSSSLPTLESSNITIGAATGGGTYQLCCCGSGSNNVAGHNTGGSGGSGGCGPFITSLPPPLLQIILVSAAGSAGGAVRSCKALHDAWRAALSDPVLAANYLVNRHGSGAAAVCAYSSNGYGSGGAGGGAIFRALLQGLPVERHDEAALAFVRALAAQGAVGGIALLPPTPPPPALLPPLLLQHGHQHLQQQYPQEQQLHPFGAPQFLPLSRPPRQTLRMMTGDGVIGGNGDGGGGGQDALVVVLRGAARANQTAVVRELISAGAPPVAVAAALQSACWVGNEALVRQLLRAVGLLQDSIAEGSTAAADTAVICVAAAPWPPADVSTLLAPALVIASQGRTARHVAVVDLLLVAGADPRLNDSEPLVCACAVGSTAVIRLLLRAGADPRAARCRPLVAAAEILRVHAVAHLLSAGRYSYSDLLVVARELLVPPLVSRCAALVALLLPWLAVGALLLTASAPVVFACVLLCLWNGLWVVSALSVVGYGLGLALAAAAVGLAMGMTLAAWATSSGLLLQFLIRATLRRSLVEGAASAAAAAAAEAAAGHVGVAAVTAVATAAIPAPPTADMVI